MAATSLDADVFFFLNPKNVASERPTALMLMLETWVGSFEGF